MHYTWVDMPKEQEVSLSFSNNNTSPQSDMRACQAAQQRYNLIK